MENLVLYSILGRIGMPSDFDGKNRHRSRQALGAGPWEVFMPRRHNDQDFRMISEAVIAGKEASAHDKG